MLLHGLRRWERLVLLLVLVQLQARHRLDGSAVAAADAKTFAVPDAGARRSFGSTSLRADASTQPAADATADAAPIAAANPHAWRPDAAPGLQPDAEA